MAIHVASHKSVPTASAPFYRPLALGGRVLEGFADSDASGNSIAALNPHYCELTATWWIWKNIGDDLVGLCHYRRYFNLIPSNRQHQHLLEIDFDDNVAAILSNPLQWELAERALEHYDIVLPYAAQMPSGVGSAYTAAHDRAEWEEFLGALDLLYGPREHAMRLERRFYQCNMFICRRALFERYAAQLFFVVDRVFERIGVRPPVAGARYQPGRYPGYLAERFMSAFVNANRLRVYEAQLLLLNNL